METKLLVTHKSGINVDIRPFTKDGKPGLHGKTVVGLTERIFCSFKKLKSQYREQKMRLRKQKTMF